MKWIRSRRESAKQRNVSKKIARRQHDSTKANRKLSRKSVLAIRNASREGHSVEILSDIYHVSKNTVRRILEESTYRDA